MLNKKATNLINPNIGVRKAHSKSAGPKIPKTGMTNIPVKKV